MASLTRDSEIMTQQIAAVAVPNTHKFSSAFDELGNIMVFSVGNDGTFYLVKQQDSTSARMLVNLNEALKIPTSKVTAFGVSQNPDSTIYLVIATQSSPKTPSTPVQTDLLVLKPFKPKDVDLSSPSPDLSPYIMPRTTSGKTSISAIFMDTSNKGQSYPPIVVAYVPLDRVSSSADVALIDVQPNFSGWQLSDQLHLPENAEAILDLCPARLPLGRGFFTLYTVQGQLRLTFTTIDKEYPDVILLSCPNGTQCLSTFLQSDGYTALLAGGQSLNYWSAKDAQTKKTPATMSTDAVFKGVVELFVSQTGEKMSILATNSAQGVGYIVASVTNPMQNLNPTPLIPNNQGGTFAPLVSAANQSLQVIVSDSHGALTILQEDSLSGIWTSSPFYTPSLDQNLEMQAYTVHLNLQNADLTPMVDQTISLSSTGLVEVVVNGRSTIVGPAGVDSTTDGSGTITIIVPSPDISSYVFHVDNASNGPKLFSEPVFIDPTFKVNDQLAKIENGNDLREAKLQDGTPLLAGSPADKQDVDEAGTYIGVLTKERAKYVDNLSNHRGNKRPPRENAHFKPGTKRRGQDLGKFVCGRHTRIIKESDSITDTAWAAWHWFTNLVDKVVSWTVEETKDTYYLIVHFAEEGYRFILNGLTEIGNGISWIFEKVLAIAEKIIKWIGFILNWSDIKATHLSIKNMANSALLSGSDNLHNLAKNVDQWFTNLETTVKAEIYPARLKETDATPQSTQGPVPDAQKGNLNSTQGNYTNYQFQHGGAMTASQVKGSQNPLTQVWDDIVEPAIASLKQSIGTIGSDISMLFHRQGSSLTAGQVIEKLGADVIIGIIDVIRSVIVGLINFGADILADFKAYLNHKINIPIFSALWKTYISGEDLSILDGLALLLAVPVTIINKLVTGKKPADLSNLNYNDLVTGKITDPDQMHAINKFNGLTAFTSNGLLGLTQVLNDFSAVSEVSGDNELKRRAAHPLDHLLDREKHRQHGHDGHSLTDGYSVKTDWRLGLGTVSKVMTIPYNTAMPAESVRIDSWLIGCAQTLLQAGIRSAVAGGAGQAAVAKGLATYNAALGFINFIMVSVVNGEEFATPNFPDKDNMYTTMQIFSSIFDLVNTEASAAAIMDDEPLSKAVFEAISYAGMGLSYTVTGAVTLVKLETGKYNYIIDKLNV